MNYTDEQLKRALAKMLPALVKSGNNEVWGDHLAWVGVFPQPVRDTELLHLCWLVEKELRRTNERGAWLNNMALQCDGFINAISAPWQQRVIALAKVKGIEI